MIGSWRYIVTMGYREGSEQDSKTAIPGDVQSSWDATYPKQNIICRYEPGQWYKDQDLGWIKTW